MIEADELHTRVAHILAQKGYCFVNEYRYLGGQIDFAAIHKNTGKLAVIECKVRISNSLLVVDQINGYHDALGTSSAAKWVFTFVPLAQEQSNVFEENGIEVFTVDSSVPKGEIPKSWDMLAEFEWYFYKWRPNEVLLPFYAQGYRKADIANLRERVSGSHRPYTEDTSGDVWAGQSRMKAFGL